MLCPSCGVYGDIHKLRDRKNLTIVYVCMECYHLWPEGELSDPPKIDLDDYILMNKLEGNFETLFEDLGKVPRSEEKS